ncbi:MAG: cell division protein ZapA [Trichlorobacter sp.]|uniref:cell division protein ZapA n=1 Tax=Trichlorobacter sp. TaxID=2911007 RepID=UPI00256E2A70|nr:cell division protein ZapA [Trichlorobacter sp.]
MIKAHLVTVLGREIPVRSSAPETKVREVETFVNSRIETIRERLTTADPQLLVTLALLNLSESYLDLQGRQEGSSALETRIASMLEKIDNVL